MAAYTPFDLSDPGYRAFYASQLAASGGEQSMGGSAVARKLKFQGGPFAGKTQSEAQQAAIAAWQTMVPEARAKFMGAAPQVSKVGPSPDPAPTAGEPPTKPMTPRGDYSSTNSTLRSLGVSPAAPVTTPSPVKPLYPQVNRPSYSTPNSTLTSLGVRPAPEQQPANKPMLPTAAPPQVINGATFRSPTETQFQTGTVITNPATGGKTLQSRYGSGSATFGQSKRTGPTVFDGGKAVDLAASRAAGTIVTTAPNKPMMPGTAPARPMATTAPNPTATVQNPVSTPAAKPVVAAAPPNKPAPPTFVTMSPDQRQAYLQQQINAPAPTGPSVLQRAKANQTYPDVNAIRQARADQEAAKPLISKAAGAVASAASMAGQGLSELSQVGTGMWSTAFGVGKDLAKATFVGDPDKAKKAAATLQAANKPMPPPMVRR